MDNIDISGYTSVVLSVAFAGAGPDSGEDLFMDISYDNGSTWTGTGSIQLVDGYSNTPIDINTTNASNPTTVGSNPWPTNIGASETQIRVRFRCINLDASEYYFIDDVKLTGTASGSTPPTLNADATDNNVDNNIDITFTDDATWRAAVTAVKIGGTALTVTTDYVLSAGNLQLKPSGLNALLTTAGSKSVTVEATGYSVASVTQQIDAGAATKLGIKTQPTAPVSNGAVLATQPAVYIQDQYGNTTTSTATVVATVGAETWTLGGTSSVEAVAGTTTYSDLTATSAAAVSGATISFTSSGLTGINSSTFDIPAPPLNAPVATAATDISTTGFSANWNAAAGAVSYRLDVSPSSQFDINNVSENFSGFTTNNGSADRSSNLDSYLQTTGWTGTAIYEMIGYAKMGSSSSRGTITTNTLDLSANSGNATLTFDLLIYGSDATLVQVFHASDGTNFTQVGSDITPPVIFTTQTISISGGTINSKIRIAAKNTSNSRFYLDNIIVIQSMNISGYNNLTVSGTSQAVTGLTPNTAYYYRVRATDGIEISANSNTITTSTDASAASTYTGSGNWSDVGNWSDGIPGSTTNVTVNGTLTVDDVIECNNLTISTSGAVTVTAGQGLAVNGDLLLQSSDAGTGSFIGAADDYTITGSTTLQRYLTNYSTGGDNKYHLLSSPVSSQPIQPEFVANSPAVDVDFYKFDEPTATWVNTKTEANAWNDDFEDNFLVGRGYLVAYPTSPITKLFTGGTLNSYSSGTPLVITCTNTNAGGWNLIGNPFPSAIDWDLVTKGDGMDNALYYYDHDAANYRYYVQLESVGSLGSGSRYIPAMQGFMVHAKTSGTKTVSLHNGHRVHSTQAFYKAQNEINNLLTVKLQANGKADEAYILYFDEATESFDSKFDAYKLFSYAEGMPQLYTISVDEAMLAINTLPTQSDSKAVALGYKAANAGTHSMSFEGLTSFAQPGSLQLEDKLLGIMHTITDGPYEFVSEAGTVNDRFVLHFGAVGVSEKPESATLKAYMVNGQLYFNLQGEATLEIVDLQGRVLAHETVNGQGLTSHALNLPAGAYIVRLTGSNSAQTAKVIVK